MFLKQGRCECLSFLNIVSRVSLSHFFGCSGVFLLSVPFLLLSYLSLLQSVCGVWVPLGPALLQQIPDKESCLGPAGWVSAACSSAPLSCGSPSTARPWREGQWLATKAPLCVRATIAAFDFWNDWRSNFSFLSVLRSQVFLNLCFQFCP